MVVRDLWVGADVRWQGPETVRKGVQLRPGDRAVVVDAGRHHITSFSSLHSPARTRRPRPGRGVTIELVTFTAEALIDVLASATTTPEDVFIAV